MPWGVRAAALAGKQRRAGAVTAARRAPVAAACRATQRRRAGCPQRRRAGEEREELRLGEERSGSGVDARSGGAQGRGREKSCGLYERGERCGGEGQREESDGDGDG
jgi:hypothetical protein